MMTLTTVSETVFRLLLRLRLHRLAATWAHASGLVWLRCQALKGDSHD